MAAAGGELRRSCRDASPTPFWLDSAGATGSGAHRSTGDAECDLAIVGAGLSGLWAALLAKEERPGRERDRARRRTGSRTRPAAATAASSSPRSPTGSPTAWPAFPEEMPALERLGLENFDGGDRDDPRGTGSTATSSSPATLDVAVEPHEVEWLAERGARAASASATRSTLLDRDRGPGRGRLAALRGGRLAAQRRRARRPGEALLGTRAMPRAGSGVRICEHTPVERLARRRGRASSCGPDRARAGAPGAARDQRLPAGWSRAIRRRIVPVYDYVLVTEPLTAAQRARARLGEPPGARRLREPVPLLPADRRRPDPLGRLRRDLPLRRRDRPRTSSSARRASPGSPQHLLRPRFRSSRGSASATAGAARSTPAAASSPSTAPRSAAGSPTRSATPGSASAPSRFGAGVALDLLAGRETEATRLRAIRSQADPVPARAAALGGDRAHPPPARRRRPQPRPARAVAADARPARARLRQLSRLAGVRDHGLERRWPRRS